MHFRSICIGPFQVINTKNEQQVGERVCSLGFMHKSVVHIQNCHIFQMCILAHAVSYNMDLNTAPLLRLCCKCEECCKSDVKHVCATQTGEAAGEAARSCDRLPMLEQAPRSSKSCWLSSANAGVTGVGRMGRRWDGQGERRQDYGWMDGESEAGPGPGTCTRS